MALMMLEPCQVRSIIKSNAKIENYDQYCNNYFYWNEWRDFTVMEKRKLFEEYVDESSMEQLVNDLNCKRLFTGKLSIIGDEVTLMV
jgi:hypothetical protein